MARAQTIALPREFQALLDAVTTAQVADDQQWILSLLRKQGLAVINMLWRVLGQEADVLDAYQTAVCQLTARGPGGIGSNPAGYFYRTAMNAAIEMLRSRQMRRKHWPEVVELQVRQGEGPRPEEAIDQRTAANRLRRAVAELPPHLRGVIVLRDLAELPYGQVSGILGIRVSTARLYRRQAVVRLAELLGEETDE